MSTSFRALRDSDGNIIDRDLTYARGATHPIAVTGSAVGSSVAFTAGTQFTEVWATVDAFVRFAPSSSLATASSSDYPLPARERLILQNGAANRWAAVIGRSTSSGDFFATEL